MRYEGNIPKQSTGLATGDVLILGNGSIRYICESHDTYHAMDNGVSVLARSTPQKIHDFYANPDTQFKGIVKIIKRKDVVIKEVE